MCKELRDITGSQSHLQFTNRKQAEWMSNEATKMWLLAKGVNDRLENVLKVST